MPSIWEKHITTLEIEIKNKDSTDEYYIIVSRKISTLIQELKIDEELINKPIPKFIHDPEMVKLKNEIIYLRLTIRNLQPQCPLFQVFIQNMTPSFRQCYSETIKKLDTINENKIQDHLFWIEGKPHLKDEILQRLSDYAQKNTDYLNNWSNCLKIMKTGFHSSKLLQRMEECSMDKVKKIAEWLFSNSSDAGPWIEIALEMIKQNQIESALEIYEHIKTADSCERIIVEVIKKFCSTNEVQKAIDLLRKKMGILSQSDLNELVSHICDQYCSMKKPREFFTLMERLFLPWEILEKILNSASEEKEYSLMEELLVYHKTLANNDVQSFFLYGPVCDKSFDILIKLVNCLIKDHKINDAKILIKKYNEILIKANYYQSARLLYTSVSLGDTDAAWQIIKKHDKDRGFLAIAKTAFQKHFFNEEAEKVDQLIASIKK